MRNAQENTEMPMSEPLCKTPRTNSDVVCELSYERREVSINLARLKKAIGERIKDLIDNG